MFLDIHELMRSYGSFQVEASLSLDEGETLVLTGPSGCGKTTLLRMIAGLSEADSGTIHLDGEDISRLKVWKREIGFVFQDLALFPHLSVASNIAYGPFVRGVKRGRRQELVRELLALVRLEGYGKRRITGLSGGEKQRIAIARVLACKPKLLLMDEPFSSLDAPLRLSLRGELRRILDETKLPCIFVTHDREEARAMGDRIAVMDRGSIVETGSAQKLFTSPEKDFTARFLGLRPE